MAVRSIPTIASTGLACRVRVFSAGTVYNNSGGSAGTFEAYNDTDATTGHYNVTATEQGTSGIFNWTEPAVVAALTEYEAVLLETVSGALVGVDSKGPASTYLTTANISQFASLLRGTITIVQGDAFLTLDGRQLDFVKPTGANWPTNLTGATVTLSGTRNADKATVVSGESATFSIAGSVVTTTGDSQTVRFEIPAATSLLWSVGQGAYDYRVRATGGSVNGLSTLATGLVNVLTD
jgi:hypothetical protein